MKLKGNQIISPSIQKDLLQQKKQCLDYLKDINTRNVTKQQKKNVTRREIDREKMF